MQVTAISSPRYPEWRWRISDYAGETVEESHVGFPSIAAAVSLDVVDRSDSAARPWPVRAGRR